MDKNSILEAARKSTNKEFEDREYDTSILLGVLAAVVVGVVIFLVKYFCLGYISYELISVGMIIFGVNFLYTGIRVGEKNKIVAGVLSLIIALWAIYMVIMQVV